jgi:hypothetical protein
MIDENATLNKIKKFVTDEYSQLPKKGALVVKSVGNSYRVNDIRIEQNTDGWSVINNGSTIAVFHQRRLAILSAALVSKRQFSLLSKTNVIDRQLDIYLADQNQFKIRTKMNPQNAIHASRLSKVNSELDILEQEILLLEKSCSLA